VGQGRSVQGRQGIDAVLAKMCARSRNNWPMDACLFYFVHMPTAPNTASSRL
jgi:hypothetical protein